MTKTVFTIKILLLLSFYSTVLCMSVSATIAQNQEYKEPLNLFPKGSETRKRLIHFIVHCVIQTLILAALFTGIIASGCCLHPVFFVFFLTLIPVYLSLRYLASERLRNLYRAFDVYPSEDEIHSIIFSKIKES
ncbi:hypothetical protein [Chlamydia felis Fe/C-56]|uniref:Uncharacterized protein n=1 Tax=Chlamydia felis (strain Fe/C-56) TaxID=264202 RepID=Q253I2_CHLFF|nr:hypothetical protein [Chlamydia felis Fe/C-56]